MGDHHIKPGSPGDILAHHGIKGMRWGVRKDDSGSGNRGSSMKEGSKQSISINENTKAYIAAAQALNSKKKTPEEALASLRENDGKFSAKFFPPSPPRSDKPGGLTDTQKKVLIGAGLTVGIGAGIYFATRSHGGLTAFRNITGQPGKPIGHLAFNNQVSLSKMHSWGSSNSYFHANSMTREGFELPVGHQFYRISSTIEDKFSHVTYSTHSLEDYNRYLSGFTQEIGTSNLKKITWEATKPVKVPSTTEVLDTLRDVMQKDWDTMGLGKVSHAGALEQYQNISGSGWNSTTATGLISALRKKGFSAVVDEMDAGVIGETPLVFFGTDAAGPKFFDPISKSDYRSAIKNLTEIKNRKTFKTKTKHARVDWTKLYDKVQASESTSSTEVDLKALAKFNEASDSDLSSMFDDMFAFAP